MMTASHFPRASNSIQQWNEEYSVQSVHSLIHRIFGNIYSESLTPESDSVVQEIRMGWGDAIRTSETLERWSGGILEMM